MKDTTKVKVLDAFFKKKFGHTWETINAFHADNPMIIAARAVYKNGMHTLHTVEYTREVKIETIFSTSIMVMNEFNVIVEEAPLVDIEFLTKSDLTLDELDLIMNKWTIDDVFNDTKAFQEKYGLMDDNPNPHFIAPDQVAVKIGHLHEELAEIEKAHTNGDLVEFADGIIDLIYVAAGLGALCKLPMRGLWNDVQNSNMYGKKRVENLQEATKRGSTFDVRKTPEWIGPRGKDIIEHAKSESK